MQQRLDKLRACVAKVIAAHPDLLEALSEGDLDETLRDSLPVVDESLVNSADAVLASIVRGVGTGETECLYC